MVPVIAVLEGECLPGVKGSRFLLEGKILLDKSGFIHYDRRRRGYAVRHVPLLVIFVGRARLGEALGALPFLGS